VHINGKEMQIVHDYQIVGLMVSMLLTCRFKFHFGCSAQFVALILGQVASSQVLRSAELSIVLINQDQLRVRPKVIVIAGVAAVRYPQ
jgi:hypothetical protein